MFTVGAANRSDPAQMILRLFAVALFDLPQAIILPSQHMVRIGLQRALVPDLRELVVAEFAIGIADQIGHVCTIILAKRLQLLDGGGIIVAVVDRRIGGAVALLELLIVDTGLLVGLLGLLGGLGVRRRRGGRRPRISTSTSTTSSSR